MKIKFILSFFLMAQSFSALSSITDFSCVGDLTKDNYSRRTHLAYDVETGALAGYKAAWEIGGVIFTAKERENKIRLEMARDKGDGMDSIVIKDFSSDEPELFLETQLEEGFVASLLCFKV